MKRKSSMGLEKVAKTPRQQNALDRNKELSTYLDTLVAGTAPEQQISLDRLQTLGLKPGVIDIDNDYDDIDDYEREEAEKANAEVMEKIDFYSKDMMQSLRSRHKSRIPASSVAIPPKTQIIWNPFKNPLPPMTPEEERQIESCNLFVSVSLYRSLWKSTRFDSINHFRNVAKQALNVEHNVSDTIQFSGSHRDAFVSWCMTNDELLSSPIEQLRFAAKLQQQQQDDKWIACELWLVPDTIVITAQ